MSAARDRTGERWGGNTLLRGIVSVLALALLGAVARPAALAAPVRSASYADGALVAGYRVVFAGYGEVRHTATSTGPAFTLRPEAATAPGQTHSALVVSQRRFGANGTYAVRVTTQRQLRTGSVPNPWETGWVVFNYTDPDHFYYLAMKTNGWELGKRDPAYPGGQRFLATGSSPAALVGRADRVVVTAAGSRLVVKVNGKIVTRFTDAERPYLGGSFGFYSEDAQVLFDRISTP